MEILCWFCNNSGKDTAEIKHLADWTKKSGKRFPLLKQTLSSKPWRRSHQKVFFLLRNSAILRHLWNGSSSGDTKTNTKSAELCRIHSKAFEVDLNLTWWMIDVAGICWEELNFFLMRISQKNMQLLSSSQTRSMLKSLKCRKLNPSVATSLLTRGVSLASLFAEAMEKIASAKSTTHHASHNQNASFQSTLMESETQTSKNRKTFLANPKQNTSRLCSRSEGLWVYD